MDSEVLVDELLVLSCEFGFFWGSGSVGALGFWGIEIEGPLGFRIKVLGFSGKGGFLRVKASGSSAQGFGGQLGSRGFCSSFCVCLCVCVCVLPGLLPEAPRNDLGLWRVEWQAWVVIRMRQRSL